MIREDVHLFFNTGFNKILTLKLFSEKTTTLLVLLLFCSSVFAQKPTVRTQAGDIEIETLAEDLEHPWGMVFLPDDRLLFTERAGTVRILDTAHNVSEPLEGTPEVFAHGQGGMLDVALDPNFEQNNTIYLSYSQPGQDSTATTALGRGVLDGNRLRDFEVIFKMEPVLEGPNHFGGRILFEDDDHILLTLADRFKDEPAQDQTNTLGTIVRIHKDGTIPQDNPFIGDDNVHEAIWSYGHRNIESAAIDPQTNLLWVAEMGPMGGDELNQPQPGKNYGWPEVSHGKHYDGEAIPHPSTRPEFEDALIEWTPTISPSGMIFYTGDMFPQWQNHALIGGLTSTGLVRVSMTANQAQEEERIPLAVRTRDVAQASDGSIYVLTDEENGKILRLKLIEE